MAAVSGLRELGKATLAVVTVAVVLAAAVWTNQHVKLIPEEAFIYYPVAALAGSPADRGLDFEDVRFTAEDGVALHGWFVEGTRPVTILWFHGNAGNISHRVDRLALLNQELGASVFLFDYRGYGRSGGSPSEQGLYHDARAALAQVRERREDDAVVYFGVSLGAAVAADLALDHAPAGLVLESPFTSVPAMARRMFPFLFFDLPLRHRYDTAAKLSRSTAPLLIIHGGADSVVPVSMGEALYAAAGEPKRLVVIEDADHNDLYERGGEAYWEAWEAFLASIGDRG